MNLYKTVDHLGIIVFAFLILDSVFYIRRGQADWRVYSRLLIGIGGLLIDGYLVFIY